MIELVLNDTDRIEWALKAFKRKVQKSGILKELRRRRHHVKPSVDYRVSMGVYGVSRDTLAPYTPGLPLGFDELVLDLLKAGNPPHAYEFDGYWLDIGRPDDYDRANAEFTTHRALLLKGA